MEDHIKALEAFVANPRLGLPEPVFEFASRIVPMVNVDLLIRDGRRRTLLTWRDDDLYGHGWHIPGGILRFQERFADRIAAVAASELGARVIPQGQPLAITQFIDISASGRGHFISLLFDCKLGRRPDEKLRAVTDHPERGQWRWFEAPPSNLIAVHRRFAKFMRRG